MSTLYDAYIQGEPALSRFFATMPHTLFADAPPCSTWADGIADTLNETQVLLDGTNAPVAGNELVIATGQQTGLFTGPLYTIYKAVTAVKIAERFRAAGTPCVPVFWVAGDDHDFEEARSAHFLTKRHDLLTLTYTPRDAAPTDMPMYRVPLEKQAHDLIDEAASACRSGEYAGGIREFLHDSLDTSDTLADWFARIMAMLFRNTPLRIFLPWQKAARLAAVSVLEQEIRHPLASTRLLLEQGALLTSLGYEPAIQRAETACNFFVEQEGRRQRVSFMDNAFHIEGAKAHLSAEAMLALLASSPERFSPNVALRPVIQQQLFPVAAYVAGPGEVAYWAQLKPLFDFFGTPMPVVYPRIRCVLNTIKTNQLLHQYGLTSTAIMENDDVLARALRADAASPAITAFARSRPAVVDALEQMAVQIRDEGGQPDATDATARFQHDTLAGLDKLERRLLHADTEKRHTVEARLERLRTVIAPLNRPQERVLSVFSFLFEHGLPLIGRMADELELDCFTVQEMEL